MLGWRKGPPPRLQSVYRETGVDPSTSGPDFTRDGKPGINSISLVKSPLSPKGEKMVSKREELFLQAPCTQVDFWVT